MALVKGDGSAIGKTPGTSVLQSVAETDPKVKVLIDVYEMTPYDNVKYPTQERQLAFRTGQVIRTSEWNAKFATPTVASISPATGPAAGGTSVTVKGSGFSIDAGVKFGATAATNLAVVDSGTITCKSPAGSTGAVDVVVTTAGGSATLTGGYTFT